MELSPMQVVSTSSSDDATNGGATPNSTASAAELRGITNEESPTGKARSPEKVLIYDREHRPVCDKISSDDKSGVVDEEVGEKLQTRAHVLDNPYVERSHAQACVLRGPGFHH